MARNRLSMLRGRFTVSGRTDLKVMDVVRIVGVGSRFDGPLVTGLAHRVDGLGWRTDIQLGLSPEGFCLRDGIADPPAAGLLPPARGLQVGVVDGFQEDPSHLDRIRVRLRAVDRQEVAVWARLAAPDAGKSHGVLFRPEPGDEVVVGFFNGDPRQAVILGALFSPSNTPEGAPVPSEANADKALITKGKTTIRFHDDPEGKTSSLTVRMASQAEVVLDDGGKTVRIRDPNGNTITLGESGITIKSVKDLEIQAEGAVKIQGTTVDVK